LNVSLYVRSTPPTVAVVEVAQSVAASVSTSVLISDDAPNPYSMTLVVPTGTTATVYLDVEALDSDGAYVVVQRPPNASERSEVAMQRILDGRKIGTEDEFHLELCQLLEMGPYYGRNLDALWDRLSRDIERPITLVWSYSGESRRRMGPVFDQIVEILEAVKQEDAGFNWTDRFDYRLE
jgi:ribonuclease inhibitor